MDIKIQNDVAQGGGARANKGAKSSPEARNNSAEIATEETIDRDTVSIQGGPRESVSELREADKASELAAEVASTLTYDQLLSAHGGLDPARVAALLDEEA